MRIVLVTVPAENAHDISRAVLRDHLAAGVSIIRGVDSIFWWKGQLERQDEALLVMRTEERLLKPLWERVKEIHPYEVPEMLVLSAAACNRDYQEWLKEVLAPDDVAGTTGAPAATRRFETVADVLKSAAQSPLKVVVVGAPGSGVRTLGHRIARRLRWPFYAPIEKHLLDGGVDGDAAGSVEKGELIPDEIVLRSAAPALESMKDGGVVAGFPLTMAQVGLLQQVWKQPDVVFLLNISEAEAAENLRGRLSCSCGATYGVDVPPRKPGVCDACGQKLFRRRDDLDEQALKERFRVWTTQSRPLILKNFASVLHPLEAGRGYRHVLQEASATLMKVLGARGGEAG